MMLQRQREYTINSVTFIQVLYTLQRGDGHLAKRLILRLPKTKLEKEKNTYTYSEKLTRDVQAPIGATERSSR